jgi:hypothetical protein
MPLRSDDMTDLDRPVTRRELREELKAFATKDDLRVMRDECCAHFDELRTHFDMVAEGFKADFAKLYDWTVVSTNSLVNRLETTETGHGARLFSLENASDTLENLPRKPPSKP